jgi:NADH-quinone oxidoreductase subunit N
MLFLMFSTAGVPPFVGFWAKLQIFQALWNTQHTVLLVIAALMSVIGLYYYLRIVKIMYFDAPADMPVSRAGLGLRLVLGINALAVLVLGLFPGPLLDLCARVLS